MTDSQARAKFEKLCAELHEEGWDVLCAISKTIPGGTDTVQRTLIKGDGKERAQAFLTLNRTFRNELIRASEALFAPPQAGSEPRYPPGFSAEDLTKTECAFGRLNLPSAGAGVVSASSEGIAR